MIRLPSFSDLQAQLFATAKRFPLPTLCALILTVLSFYSVHLGDWDETWVWRTMLTAMLGLLALTGLSLATESIQKSTRGIVMLMAVALLGLYWWSFPTEIDEAGSQWIIRHVFLCLASFFALIWAPYWQQNVSNSVLWRWDTDTLGKLLVTSFFALVLFLGSAAALWSVDALFGLDIDEKLYFDLWILAAACFTPLFFLSQLEKTPLKLKAPKTIDRFMGIFTKYIMTPIAMGYMLILYAYTAKILITWEWPKNVLGWLVICFLGVAIFTYFLWTPILERAKSTPSKLLLKGEELKRIFWLVLIPQIVLLFVAIGWRIHAYSWTENRYFVVILGAWLLGTTFYFLLKKDARFKWIFVALTGVILVSQIGPLSGYNVGKYSQTKRLWSVLEEVKILQDGQIVPTKIEVNDDLENEIASILDYLDDRYGRGILEDLFPQQMTDIDNKYSVTNDLMNALGLDYRSKWDRSPGHTSSDYFNYYTNPHQPRQVSGYDWRVVPAYEDSRSDAAESNFPYAFTRSSSDQAPAILVHKEGNLVDTIALEKILQKFQNDNTLKEGSQIDSEKMVYWHESDLLEIKIYFLSFSGSNGNINHFDVEMYVRLKDEALLP